MTDRDTELMRQALDAIVAPGLSATKTKQARVAAADALLARLAEPVQAARWYVLSFDGMACLCADQADAQTQAADADKLFPRHAPHRAVQMAPITAPGAAPTVQPVAVPDGMTLVPMTSAPRLAARWDGDRWVTEDADSAVLTRGQVREAAQAEISDWMQTPKGAIAADAIRDLCRRLGVELEAPKGGA